MRGGTRNHNNNMKQDLFDILLARKKEIQAELHQVNAAIQAVQQASLNSAIKAQPKITSRTRGITGAVAKICIRFAGQSLSTPEILAKVKEVNGLSEINSQAVHQACSYLTRSEFLLRVEKSKYSLHPEFNKSKFYLDNNIEMGNLALTEQ